MKKNKSPLSYAFTQKFLDNEYSEEIDSEFHDVTIPKKKWNNISKVDKNSSKRKIATATNSRWSWNICRGFLERKKQI